MLNDALQNNAVEILDLGIKAFGFILTIILTYASSKLPGKWRQEAQEALVKKEAELRSSLHMAARTGVTDGAARGLTGAALVAHALRHVVSSVPDAIVELTPTTKEVIDVALPGATLNRLPKPVHDVLERIVRSYIN